MIRTKAILKYLGFVLLFNALFLCISASISFFLHENSFIPLLYGTLVCVALGILPQIFIAKIEDITFQEGIAISVLGWIITCLVGMIPYLVWGGEFTLANSLFESVSGFTTTGATILNDVEILPKGLLFWRASTHFIGGIGIILFVLVILPEKKRIRSSIYHSEVSGLSMLNFQMKTKKIVNIIAIVYISLITVETVLLKFFGMNWFDAVCHSFATVATGGFSTKNASVAHYNSISIEIIIMFFMLISSMHFGLVYNLSLIHIYSFMNKKLFNVSLALATAIILFATSCSSSLKPLSQSNFKVTPSPLETVGMEVPVTVNGTFPEKWFHPNATVTITPVLKYAGNKELKATPYTYQGEKAAGNGITISKKRGGNFVMNFKFPYQKGMEVAELFMRFDAQIKNKKANLPDVKVADGVITTSVLADALTTDPSFSDDNFQRIIKEKQEEAIMFLIESAELRQSELTKEGLQAWKKRVEEAFSDPKQQIALEIGGYASPDGPLTRCV